MHMKTMFNQKETMQKQSRTKNKSVFNNPIFSLKSQIEVNYDLLGKDMLGYIISIVFSVSAANKEFGFIAGRSK